MFNKLLGGLITDGNCTTKSFKNAQIISELHLKMIEYNHNICCNE